MHGARNLDWQLCGSELEAHRGYLQLDDDYVRVLTLKELPGETRPLLLQGLFDISANFHVVMEWHPVYITQDMLLPGYGPVTRGAVTS